MKKIILTGGTGFVGLNIKHELDSLCYDVYSVNRTELTSFAVSPRSFDFKNSDALIHLVGAAHREYSDADARLINFEITKSVFNQALQLGVKRFIFISSVNLGTGQGVELAVDAHLSDFDLINNKISNVNQSKMLAEAFLKSKASLEDIEVVIIRSPLVYGKGVKANFFSLMNLIYKGLPLPFGSITSNKRSLVSVVNLIDLIITCIDHPKAPNNVFFVSDDYDISTSELVRELSVALGKPTRQIPIPVWVYKIFGRLFNKTCVIDRLVGSLPVDISYTKTTLGWSPPQTLQEGFKQTAEAFIESKKR